jgi:hypothetical protein
MALLYSFLWSGQVVLASSWSRRWLTLQQSLDRPELLAMNAHQAVQDAHRE